MVEKDLILKEKMWYVGICNFKAVYEYVYDWLTDEDYFIVEDKYKENNKGDAREIEIKWKASKQITDYFRINLELAWKVLGLVDVEVEIDGKKKKMNKVAELTVTTKGQLEKDYNSKWGSSSFNRFLKETYDKYVVPKRTEQMEEKVASIVQDLNREIKSFLDLTGIP